MNPLNQPVMFLATDCNIGDRLAIPSRGARVVSGALCRIPVQLTMVAAAA
jgi:hypothetical protein